MDFQKAETSLARKRSTIQGGVLFGFMPNTTLIVYKGCFAEAYPARRALLNYGLGDVILIRGDLVHAGASFDHINYRNHTNLKVDGVDCDDNATEFAPPRKYMRKKYPTVAPSKKALHNHWRWCEMNPGRQKAIQGYKERIERGAECSSCSRSFRLGNSMIKHSKRCTSIAQDMVDEKVSV